MKLYVVASAALALGLLCGPAAAQTMGPPAGSTSRNTSGTVSTTRDSMTQEQFNRLQEYADRAKRLTKDDKAKGKTLKEVLAEDKATVEKLVATMPLSCKVTDAMQIAQGPTTIDGKTVETKTYETACASGMGYFLVTVEPGKPYGFSCMAAEASAAADKAAGRKPGTVCQLPENANIKTMLASVMSHAGVACTVKDHRWVGQNKLTKTEFNEVACTDGKGYMLATALPGLAAPARAFTCHEAAMKGLPCKLTKSSEPVVTLQTFKDALAKHGVECQADAKDIHVFGKEKMQKRYVVQFNCRQSGKSLVAFIPLADSTTPFEALDCKTAAKRGFQCR